MLVSIEHEIEVIYSSLVSESVVDLRLVPQVDAHQTLRNFKLLVGPETQVFDYSDWQGNRVHHFSISGVHDYVVIWASSLVDVHPRPWRLEELEDSLPISKLDHRYKDYLLPHGKVQFDPCLEQLAHEVGLLGVTKARHAIAAVLAGLPAAVRFQHVPSNCNSSSVPAILAHGEGGADDYAHVAIALLRLVGIPARYVSGYLLRRGAVEMDTHAWIEAFVPSVGWLGMDPRHGQLIGDSHVALAIGRSQEDALPQRGTYRGHAERHLKVKVRAQDAQTEPHDTPLRQPRVNNRVLIDLLLSDRTLTATSLRQQVAQ